MEVEEVVEVEEEEKEEEDEDEEKRTYSRNLARSIGLYIIGEFTTSGKHRVKISVRRRPTSITMSRTSAILRPAGITRDTSQRCTWKPHTVRGHIYLSYV